MIRDIRQILQHYAGQPLTRQSILHVLEDYKRPYDKISELVKQGALVPVRKGIYLYGPALDLENPNPFLLANHLHGPSYLSLETALSYWQLIPERVYEISSVTSEKSEIFKTAVGRFSYIHLPLPYYSFGIQSIVLAKNQVALMATTEKALCDKIIATSGVLLRSTKQVKELLLDDLRIEESSLRNMDTDEMSRWIDDAPKRSSLHMLVKTLKLYD